MHPRRLALPLLASLILTASACAPTVSRHGHVVNDEELAQITPGLSTHADVEAWLGSPTAKAQFGEDVWYYVGYVAEQKAFLLPDPVEKRILEVRFDDSGTVTEMVEKDETGSITVEPVDDKTVTHGRSFGFLEQAFGNIGRFNRSRTE
ncbi:MAG: outer membrane protein assembly factor BamE [Alphaproteobacteria bacterium]